LGFKLDAKSEKILATVKPALQKVVRRAAEISPVPFAIVSGGRTQAQQDALWRIGRRGRQGERPITWTRRSNHQSMLAIDFSLVDKDGKPSNGDPHTWKWEGVYKPVADAMKKAGLELGTPVESMMDLHPHLGDLGHIQVIKGSRH
jgi:peptidoglycan L-alanyl-D-glutamate endopeptidase CwlK